MNKHRLSKSIWTVLFFFITVYMGNAKAVSAEDIYRHHSEYEGPSVAKDIQIKTNKDGSFDLTAMSDNSMLPGTRSMTPLGRSQKFFPDALGSQNIKIVIDKEVGYTMIVGLKFKQEATINIWKDGVVEVDREGVEATDESGTTWISKKVRIEGKNAIIMVRKK